MTTDLVARDPRLAAIEYQARFVQMQLWNQRRELWGTEDLDPLSALEPGVALRLKGFGIQTVDTLGEMLANGRRVQVAGIIDRENKLVSVATSRFSSVEQRFTAAHELAHAILHPHGALLHRDRPFGDAGWQKEPEEREADFFAACFLMPERQIRFWFSRLFLTTRFELTEETAFALCTKSLDSVLPRFRSIRDLSLTLARSINYNGRHFRSLAEIFRVSPFAMAIRLEQVGLVANPLSFQRA